MNTLNPASGLSGQILDPFATALENIQFGLNSISSIDLLKHKRGYESRTAARDAIKKIEEMGEETRNKLLKKFDNLTEKPISAYNQNEIVKEFNNVFQSPEFSEYKKIISHIPKSQQKNFIRAVMIKVEGKLVETRSNLSNFSSYSKNLSQQKKLTVLDQGVYEAFLLSNEIKKEVYAKGQKRLSMLVLNFVILNLKLKGFIKGKVSEKEFYNVISEVNSCIEIKDKDKVKEYLFALTN